MSSSIWAQEIPDELPESIATDADVEALARGPIHEAFAEQVNENPIEPIVVPKEPPEPINEIPPDVKPEGESVEWIPGYWGWDDEREDFLWVSGLWRNIPPGRRWVPGYWVAADDGYQWVAGTWVKVETEEVNYLPYPPESLEEGPVVAAPGEDYFWIPGCWVYRSSGYGWRPGYWSRGYDDWVWVPTRYIWTPRGCIYVSGYWDYLFSDRGSLFAPYYFHRPIYTRPGYRFWPTVVLRPSSIFAHFFVRPGYSHYYFGDYYGDRYRGLGIRPWYTVATHRHRHYDPLFSYYHWRNRHDRVDHFAQFRRQHDYFKKHADLRPPHKVAHLDDWRQKIERHPSIKENPNVKAAVLAHSLRDAMNKPDRANDRFVRLGMDQREQFARGTDRFRDIAKERQKVEVRSAAKPGIGSSERIATSKLQLPRSPRVLGPGDSRGPSVRSPSTSGITRDRTDFSRGRSPGVRVESSPRPSYRGSPSFSPRSSPTPRSSTPSFRGPSSSPRSTPSFRGPSSSPRSTPSFRGPSSSPRSTPSFSPRGASPRGASPRGGGSPRGGRGAALQPDRKAAERPQVAAGGPAPRSSLRPSFVERGNRDSRSSGDVSFSRRPSSEPRVFGPQQRSSGVQSFSPSRSSRPDISNRPTFNRSSSPSRSSNSGSRSSLGSRGKSSSGPSFSRGGGDRGKSARSGQGRGKK